MNHVLLNQFLIEGIKLYDPLIGIFRRLKRLLCEVAYNKKTQQICWAFYFYKLNFLPSHNHLAVSSESVQEVRVS